MGMGLEGSDGVAGVGGKLGTVVAYFLTAVLEEWGSGVRTSLRGLAHSSRACGVCHLQSGRGSCPKCVPPPVPSLPRSSVGGAMLPKRQSKCCL